MKNQSKLILLLFLTILTFTHYYRSSSTQSTEAFSRFLASTLDASLVTTNKTRSDNVNKFCATSKADLVSSSDFTTNQGYFTTLKTYFTVDPTSLISAGVNQNFAVLQSQAQSMGVGLGIYVVPFVIGLILSLLMWPFLCCCCTCPSCCPSKCCQKQDQILYTKCQLLWPSIFLILVLLLACAASIPGITKASILSNSIQTASCGISIILDDILNGNISSSGTTFFTGISTLNTYVASLSGNVTNIVNNFTGSVQTNVDNMITYSSSAVTHTTLIGDGSNPNATLSLTYTKPTPNSSATVTSTFVTVLGTPANSSSLTGILYNITNTLYTNMFDLNTTINTLSAQSSSITSGLDSVSSTINTFYQLIFNIDVSIGSTFSTTSTFLNYLKLAMLAFFAAVIGLSVITLLGVVTMSCFDKVGCRYLMYIMCIFILIVCILGFFISFFLSIMIPMLYFGCSVANTGLSSQSNFINLTTTLNVPSNYSNYLGICLSGGTGQILTAMGSGSITSQLGSITNVMSYAKNYTTYDTSPLTTAMANLTNVVDPFIIGSQNDIITDSGTLLYQKGLADNSIYTGCGTAVSMVPSTNAPSTDYVPCPALTTSTNCTTFSGCADTCINLDKIFDAAYVANTGSSAALSSDIGTKFTGCATLQTDLVTLYDNWYVPKVSTLNNVKTRIGTVNTDVNNVLSNVNALTTSINNTFTTLNNTLYTLIDPTNGLIAGINCQVLGEDLVLSKNTVCVTMFNSLYFLFITMGTSSFALLFSMCCIVCSGVRHYKQNEKKNGQKILNERSFNEKR